MRRSILLVEDDPSDEKLAVRAFGRSGVTHEITVVRSGAEALEYLHGEGKYAGRDTVLQPSLVLLDLKLPLVDGHEVLRRLRLDWRTRWVPVVVFTASIQEEDVARSYGLGANAYLRKPVDFAEFVEQARMLVRFWLELNVPAASRRTGP